MGSKLGFWLRGAVILKDVGTFFHDVMWQHALIKWLPAAVFLFDFKCLLGYVKSAAYIASEFSKVIEEVGPEHVVAVATDNAPNCKAAGKLIEVSVGS